MSGTTSLLFGGGAYKGDGVVQSMQDMRVVFQGAELSKVKLFLGSLFEKRRSWTLRELQDCPRPNKTMSFSLMRTHLEHVIVSGELTHDNGVFTVTEKPIFHNVRSFTEKYFHKDPSYSTPTTAIVDMATYFFGKHVSRNTSRVLFKSFNYDPICAGFFRGYRVCPMAEWNEITRDQEDPMENFLQRRVAFTGPEPHFTRLVDITTAYLSTHDESASFSDITKKVQSKLRARGFVTTNLGLDDRLVRQCRLSPTQVEVAEDVQDVQVEKEEERGPKRKYEEDEDEEEEEEGEEEEPPQAKKVRRGQSNDQFVNTDLKPTSLFKEKINDALTRMWANEFGDQDTTPHFLVIDDPKTKCRTSTTILKYFPGATTTAISSDRAVLEYQSPKRRAIHGWSTAILQSLTDGEEEFHGMFLDYCDTAILSDSKSYDWTEDVELAFNMMPKDALVFVTFARRGCPNPVTHIQMALRHKLDDQFVMRDVFEYKDSAAMILVCLGRRGEQSPHKLATDYLFPKKDAKVLVWSDNYGYWKGTFQNIKNPREWVVIDQDGTPNFPDARLCIPRVFVEHPGDGYLTDEEEDEEGEDEDDGDYEEEEEEEEETQPQQPLRRSTRLIQAKQAKKARKAKKTRLVEEYTDAVQSTFPHLDFTNGVRSTEVCKTIVASNNHEVLYPVHIRKGLKELVDQGILIKSKDPKSPFFNLFKLK